MTPIINQQVIIPAAGDVVKFSIKLPPKAAVCKGIYFNPSIEHDSQKLANASATFNSGRGNTINSMVEKRNIGHATRRKFVMLELNEPLQPNTYVEGYIEDLEASSVTYPYTVTVYFQIINQI